MKSTYEVLEIKIVNFEKKDIITTSDGVGGGGGGNAILPDDEF